MGAKGSVLFGAESDGELFVPIITIDGVAQEPIVFRMTKGVESNEEAERLSVAVFKTLTGQRGIENLRHNPTGGLDS